MLFDEVSETVSWEYEQAPLHHLLSLDDEVIVYFEEDHLLDDDFETLLHDLAM